MEHFEQKSDRVIAMTEYYLERFGKAWLGIYYLPALSENWRFTVFINSLLITLRRMDLMPVYCWFVEDNGGHYLFLCINGYFRNDLSDVTPKLNQLWRFHSPLSATEIDAIQLSCKSQAVANAKLRQFLYSHHLSQRITSNWHQRTFGMSRFR